MSNEQSLELFDPDIAVQYRCVWPSCVKTALFNVHERWDIRTAGFVCSEHRVQVADLVAEPLLFPFGHPLNIDEVCFHCGHSTDEHDYLGCEGVGYEDTEEDDLVCKCEWNFHRFP